LFCDIFADLQQIPDRAYPSCGVGRHYTGSAGKAANCQIGVCASHVSRHGRAFIDRRQQIHPAHVIAWSLWRRANQAAAQQAHLKSRM